MDKVVSHKEAMTQRLYGLRPCKPQEYIHVHATVLHHKITQDYLYKGLPKLCDNRGYLASEELLQLHMRLAIDTQDHNLITKEKKMMPFNPLCS